MDHAAQTDQLLIRNLRDAGCGTADIEQFLQLGQENRRPEQLRLLRQHRAALLDRLHVSQRQIDCLDYLIYQLKKCACRPRGDQAPADPCPPQDCGGE